MRKRDNWLAPLRPLPHKAWPEHWRESYLYDGLEVWKEPQDFQRGSAGYVCAYAHRRRRTLEALVTACPPPARVLDLAAAQGNFTIALAGLGYEVTWNDLRSDLADYVRLKTPQGVSIDFLAGNIFDLGGEQLGAWDAVVALEVIEHVAHPDRFVKQLAALLRPGGSLVLTTPNGGYALNTLPRFSDCPDPSVYESSQFKPNADGHIFLLYEDELLRFSADAGLDLMRLDLFNNPITSGHLKMRYLLEVLPDAIVGAGEVITSAMPRPLRNRLATHILAVLRKPKHQPGNLGKMTAANAEAAKP